MMDWLISYFASLQGGILRSLAVELRAGGIGAAALAFGLGALNALTPGHGKAALAAYFIGKEAHLAKGVRVALSAALLHVLSGFAAFLVSKFIIGCSKRSRPMRSMPSPCRRIRSRPSQIATIRRQIDSSGLR